MIEKHKRKTNSKRNVNIKLNAFKRAKYLKHKDSNDTNCSGKEIGVGENKTKRETRMHTHQHIQMRSTKLA